MKRRIYHYQATRQLAPFVEFGMWDDDPDTLVWYGEIANPPTADEIRARAAELEAADAAAVYKDRRAGEYPSLAQFADAYYWSQRGDDSLMDVWLAACDSVKARFPKS